MENQLIQRLLHDASLKIEDSGEPEHFDFGSFFSANGCDAKTSILLADYLICACGRGFARELGMHLSDTYQRRLSNGSWSEDIRYDADPVWLVVEKFVESIRPCQETRLRFSLIAQHSAEVDSINKALNAGSSLESLKGAQFTRVFHSPL